MVAPNTFALSMFIPAEIMADIQLPIHFIKHHCDSRLISMATYRDFFSLPGLVLSLLLLLFLLFRRKLMLAKSGVRA